MPNVKQIHLVFITTLFCVAWLLPACIVAGQDERPNVLFIAVDDLKPMLGCYGEQQIITPHIDALAARGTAFTNAHCQQAVCGPSRTSLLTGLRPDTTRVWDLKTRMRDMLPDVVTLPQYFHQHGYESVGIGKIFDSRSVDGRMHMDTASWSRPYLHANCTASESMGYLDPEWAEHIKATAEEKGVRGHDALLKLVGKRPTDMADVPDDAYIDGAVAKVAADQIIQLSKADKPFFLAVGFKKPHLPFNAPKRYWDLYDRVQIKLAEVRDAPEGSPDYHFQPGWELRNYMVPKEGPLPDDLQRELIHGYYACVSYIDAQVGLLTEALKAAGVADNTVIVLWGDHGWHLGDHGMWCKHTNYEQATRVPLIFYSPTRGLAGNRSGSPVEFVDIFPTLCELTGLPTPENLHGMSLVPVMDDGNVSVKPVAISQYPRGGGQHHLMGYALRDTRYRYIEWRRSGDRRGIGTGEVVDRELYDYQTDPLETRNLIDDAAYAETVQGFETLAQDLRIGEAP